jgi:Dihydrodipicolinate synthetase family
LRFRHFKIFLRVTGKQLTLAHVAETMTIATKPIEGIIAMLVTPFDDQYCLDEGALRAEVDWCVAQGANGIVATPSIGEFVHF